MEKVHTIGAFELHNANANDFIDTLQWSSFDVAILDPPYGIQAHKGTGREMRERVASGNIATYAWDNADSKMSKELFEKIQLVAKNQIVWGGNYFPYLPMSRGWYCWDKGSTMYGRDFGEMELAWTSFDVNTKIFKQAPHLKNRRHPTQKHPNVYVDLMRRYCKRGDRVLDLYLGSGSIMEAMWWLNKHEDMNLSIVCCELFPTYYNNAVAVVNALHGIETPCILTVNEIENPTTKNLELWTQTQQ